MTEKYIGFVKTLFHDRGYGFIRTEEGEEYFFHSSGVIPEFSALKEGHRVEFMLVPEEKGPRAIGIRIVDEFMSLPVGGV